MLLAMYSIFVFLFIGYAAQALRLVGNQHSGILLAFLLNFALPAQVFNGTYHTPIHLDFLFMCLIAFICNVCACVVLFFVAKFMRLDRGALITFCVMGVFGNTLFLGVPFINGALGESYSMQGIIFDQLVTGIPFALAAPVILSLNNSNGKAKISIKSIFFRLFKSPLFLALICGFGCRALPFHLPDWIFVPLKSLAQTATPVALFAIGVQMSFKAMLEWRLTAVLLSGKMLIAPLFFFIFMAIFKDGINDMWRMALIEVAMPPLVSGTAIIIAAGFNGKLALNSVTFGLILSFITIPIWLYFAKFL